MRKIIVAALGAFGGTLGYGYILNAPKNTILPASFIGLAGYIVYILLGMAGFGPMSAYFFSPICSISAANCSYVYARISFFILFLSFYFFPNLAIKKPSLL